MPSTVTSYADMNPSPRAVIDLDPEDLDPDTDTVTVHQLSKWGEQEVRGYTRRPLAGGLVLTDYEIPLSQQVTYRIEQFDAAGDRLGFGQLTLTTRVEIPEAGARSVGKVIVQDPVAPAKAVMLDARPGTFGQLRRLVPLQIYSAGTSTVGLAGLRSLLKDVPFILVTDTDDQRDRLDAILSTTPILIRADPKTRMPGTFYAAATAYDQAPHDPNLTTGTDDVTFTADQVTRPALAVIVALLSYDLFRDFVQATTTGTYDDARSIWLTYLDALRDPPTEQ